MSVKELQKYTFASRYPRWLLDKNRRETWAEAVDRVKGMMLQKYTSIEEEIELAYSYMHSQKVLGSQRALQFGGDPIFKHNARSYNCCASYIDRLRFFQECMYLLMCGCGTGFSVQRHHIDKLPSLTKQRQGKVQLPKKTFVIPDSIEGWSDAIGVLMSSYFEEPIFEEYYNCEVEFDPSLIRPRGAFLSSCAGKAPGPEPLMNSIKKIRELLSGVGQKLKPIEAYDIVMHQSDAVLAGGVRRSATICQFSFDDEEMYNAKIGDWYYKNPQRGRSNNSAILLRDRTTREDFVKLINSTRQFGEPAFIWADDTEQIFNPCVEAQFYGYNHLGKSGWQFCNLCSINGKKAKSKDIFIELAEQAAVIGTLQAGFTSFPYLGSVSEDITKREALLGISITGMMENPEVILNEENQREAAQAIKKKNEEIAEKIGINPSARLTNIKPEGSTSCVLGTSSGIHPHHARRYFRSVQANTTEPIYLHFKKINPIACEKSLWSNNDSDDVVTFCVEVEKGAKLKNDLPAIELLKLVKLTQENWVKAGTVVERCVKPYLRHNVSNTIQVRPDEWEEVIDFIYENRESFAGVSLLASSGDKDFVQAPFCTVYTPKEIIEQYGDASLFASGVIESALNAFDNLWVACDAALGLLKVKLKIQKDWITQAEKFAIRYFEGDIKKMTYCLKDVHNWKRWCDLKREFKEVDYTECIETEDNVVPEQVLSCAGGKCDL